MSDQILNGIRIAYFWVKEVQVMLIDKLLFADKTPLLLKKNLDFQSERNLLISSNTGNINTPGYKAQDINFQAQLDEILDSELNDMFSNNREKLFSVKNDDEKDFRKDGIKMLNDIRKEIFKNSVSCF